MNDELTASRLMIAAYLDRDEELLKVLARVLQELHRWDHQNRPLEIAVLRQMIDCYESLGRFSDAAELKLSVAVVTVEHKLATGQIHLADMQKAAA